MTKIRYCKIKNINKGLQYFFNAFPIGFIENLNEYNSNNEALSFCLNFKNNTKSKGKNVSRLIIKKVWSENLPIKRRTTANETKKSVPIDLYFSDVRV
jgi:hypothetical protein